MRRRLLNIFNAMALIFAIPIAGLGLSYAVSERYERVVREGIQQSAYENNQEADLSNFIGYREICRQNPPDLSEFCKPASELQAFELGTKLSIAFGAMLFILLFLGRVYAESNRSRPASVLPPLTKIILLGLLVSILFQCALFLFGLHIAGTGFSIAEVRGPSRRYADGFGIVIITALVGGYYLISTALRIMKDAIFSQSGVLISSANGNRLTRLVNEVADAVGAKRPDNIVVGLEPSFFVTGAKVSLNGDADVLDGTTLYMPLPFLRILSFDELRSVIGHEMGHFKGSEIEYSLKFYPAYFRLGSAIDSLAEELERKGFFTFPIFTFLVLLHGEFSVVERKIGREREIFADQEGARVGSAKGLSNALLKFSEYAQLWEGIRNVNVEFLKKGDIYYDLNDVYYNVAQAKYSQMDFDARRDDLLSFEMAHPNDTHPTLRERLNALGIGLERLSKEDLAPSDSAVSILLSDYKAIANELTLGLMTRGFGSASLPEEIYSEEIYGA